MKLRLYICRIVIAAGLFLGLMPSLSVKAAVDTCTWTGGGVDSNFSTAANWTGCDNGAVPEAGDSLVFDTSATNTTANNDIVGASFGSITTTGTDPGGFTVTGNAVTLMGGINANHTSGVVDFFINIILGANQSFSLSNANATIYIGQPGAGDTLNLGANTLTLSGVGDYNYLYSIISGTGSIVKGGESSWSLDAANTYTGSTTINEGTLGANNVSALGAASGGTNVSDGANLYYFVVNSPEVTINEPITVSGNGITSNPAVFSAQSQCLSEGCTEVSNFILAGSVVLGSNVKFDTNKKITVTGALSGSYTVSLVSGSSGQLVINSSNNTSQSPNGNQAAPIETVTVAEGDNQPSTTVTIGTNQTYIINGTRGAVTVNSGGTLKGKGTIGILTVTGTLAPGESPGCLTSGNLNLSSGTMQVEIAGTTVCTEYDQQIVNGTVDITGATLSVAFLNGFTGANGNSFIIINNDGADAVTGEFTGIADGATVTLGGAQFVVDYQGGDGNDVVLTLQVPVVPNTGFRLSLNSPTVILAITFAATIALGVVARKTY